MAFNAQLHIQGVGCYAPLEGDSKLLVVFPDGTPGSSPALNLCLHLTFVQFKVKHLVPRPENVDGYFTSFLDRDLLRIDIGGNAEGIKDIDLCHLPSMEEALPGSDEELADLRQIDPPLLGPYAEDSEGRVMGKLLVEAGEVGPHEGRKYKGRWYFREKDEAREMTSVTTVEYSGIHQLVLRFYKLGTRKERQAIELQPDDEGQLEVWVRNMCDGFPTDKTEGFDLPFTPKDEDFVLNYFVRRVFKERQVVGNLAPEDLPIPQYGDESGTVSRKCMGSV